VPWVTALRYYPRVDAVIIGISPNHLPDMLKIGPFSRSSQVIVAPMAGVTDQPFRNLCRQFGAQWVVSEMVTSDTKLWKTRKSQSRLSFESEAEPRWIQIAGADPALLSSAAKSSVDLGAQIIDINMGCPAKKVCNKAAGSALMRDERLVSEILQAVVDAVDVPVTLKIRLGWSRDEMNAESIGRIAEDCGVQLLTVHGRTRACRFNGHVDYHSIARVKDALSIPVIANGDITSPLQAKSVLEKTGADGVMIGRAVQGQPWLPGIVGCYLETGVLKPDPDEEEVKQALLSHVAALSSFYGERAGLRIARKHVGWYLDYLSTISSSLAAGFDARELKRLFYRLDNTSAQLNMIDSLFRTSSVAA
jgi:tRNA-dihydrouridine synthase B